MVAVTIGPKPQQVKNEPSSGVHVCACLYQNQLVILYNPPMQTASVFLRELAKYLDFLWKNIFNDYQN